MPTSVGLLRKQRNSRKDIYYYFIDYTAAAAAKSLQSCLTLCDPIDGSPPGSSVPGILQARILELVAISFSNACMHAKSLQLCPALCDSMDTAHQAPPSTGFSRQEYWSGCHFLLYIDCTKTFDCGDHNKLWKILKEVGIPDHVTCLQRNLYAG